MLSLTVKASICCCSLISFSLALNMTEVQQIQHEIHLMLIWAQWIRKLLLATSDYLPRGPCGPSCTAGTLNGVPGRGRGSMGKGPRHIHRPAMDYPVFDRRVFSWRVRKFGNGESWNTPVKMIFGLLWVSVKICKAPFAKPSVGNWLYSDCPRQNQTLI